MTEKERFTVDSDGNYWDKINHRYVNLDYLFRLVEELDTKLDNKQHTINEMVKTIRIYDDAYIDLNKKYKEVINKNEQLKQDRDEMFIRERDTKNEWRELKEEIMQLKEENAELRQELFEAW